MSNRPSNPPCSHTPLYMQSPVRWAERVEPCLYCQIADLTAELAGYKAALLERLDKVLAGAAVETSEAMGAYERIDPKCPNGLLPDGEVCPRCGGRRGPSGVDGGSWVHY